MNLPDTVRAPRPQEPSAERIVANELHRIARQLEEGRAAIGDYERVQALLDELRPR